VFGLGATELAVLFLIVLLIFGPSQIPKMAKGLGQAMREFRKAQREIGDELNRDDAPGEKHGPDDKPIQ